MARVVNALSILVLTIMISRKLGVDIFGGYSFLNTVILTSVVVANFGLDTHMVRELSRNKAAGTQVLWSVLGFKIISSILVILCVNGLFIFFLKNQETLKALPFYSFVICLNSLSQSFWYYGDAFNKFQFHSFLWAFSNILKIPLVWGLISFEPGLSSVIFALIAAELISLFTAAYFIQRSFNIFPVTWSLNILPFLFKHAWPLAVISILSVLYFRVDTIMLEVMKGERVVGIYSAAYKVVELLIVIPGTICIVTLPGLAVTYMNNIQAFRKSSRNTLALLGTTGAILGLFIYLFSTQIILFFYGSEFSNSIKSLSVLSGTIFFLFMNGFMAYIMIAMNKEMNVVGILILSTIINIIFNYFLIPQYSHVGAAISTLISEIFMILMYLVVICRLYFRNRLQSANQ